MIRKMPLSNIVFTKSPAKGKKYRVTFKWGAKTYVRDFGGLGYAQYKDSTGLGLYSKLDHLDKERRKRYYLRHGTTDNPLRSLYWSNKYLW